MDIADAPFVRKDFLLRIVEQFRTLAGEIDVPFRTEAYLTTNGDQAVLRTDRESQENSALRATARFVDDNDGMEEKLSLLWDCKGEVTKLAAARWAARAPPLP